MVWIFRPRLHLSPEPRWRGQPGGSFIHQEREAWCISGSRFDSADCGLLPGDIGGANTGQQFASEIRAGSGVKEFEDIGFAGCASTKGTIITPSGMKCK